MAKKRVSFLVSGRGSNFKAVAEKIRDRYIKAELGIVIADNPGAGALEIAKNFGMSAHVADPADYNSRESHEKEIYRLLIKHKTDLIVTAGYMRILTPFFVNKFRNRIINIHPALLPSFPGVHAQEKAFNYGVKVTGCTTHFIDEGTDTGPIIMQAPVEIRENDTVQSLSARILREEHRILPESIKLFCEGKITTKGRKVFIKY